MAYVAEFTWELEKGSFAALTKKLYELAGDKARVYIARALNKTAVSARVKLAAKAQASYTVKSGGFKKDLKLTHATPGSLVAILHSDGDTLSVPRFHWSHPPSGVNIDVVYEGLKPLGPPKRRAFYGDTVFIRQGKDRVPIDKVKSKSVPYMLGSENRVWGPTRPSIEADLQKYMRQQIALLVG